MMLYVLVVVAIVGAVEAVDNGHDHSNDSGEFEFPDLVTSDDVAYFFESRDVDGLHWALSNVFYRRTARNPDGVEGDEQQRQREREELPEQLVARGGGTSYTTEYKIRHDLEQAEYLAETLRHRQQQQQLDDDDGVVNPSLVANFFEQVVVPTYREVLHRIPSLEELIEKHGTGGLYPFQPGDFEDTHIGSIYNKALHLTSIDAPTDSTTTTGEQLPLVSPDLDFDAIQRRWFGEGGEENDKSGNPKQQQHPGIIVIDDLLKSETLALLQRIMWESTVWYQTKLPIKFGGYVGAYVDDGLHDKILLKLALELQDRLPRLLRGHPLKYLWAYKYDSEYTGINLHADQAAVNVNIWLTPDEANLDLDSGGLVVFTAKPPADWSFEEYNTDTDFVKERLLAPTGYANVTVPYRTNRAVIFDSALFHQTDNFKFKKGYKNRRINLTLLYGDMQNGGENGDNGSDNSNGRKTQANQANDEL